MIVFLIKQGTSNPELITGFAIKLQAIQFLTIGKGCIKLSDYSEKYQQEMEHNREYYLLPHYDRQRMWFAYGELFFIEEFEIRNLDEV